MMTQVTIKIPADRFVKLNEMAIQYQMTPEELVQAGIEELLNRREERFQQAVAYVLKKNTELYKRLA